MWPKHPDGRNKKFGELTVDEQRAVANRAAAKIQVELDTPGHPTRRTVEQILNGAVLPRTAQ